MTHPMLERLARAICRGQCEAASKMLGRDDPCLFATGKCRSWDAFVDAARAALQAAGEQDE